MNHRLIELPLRETVDLVTARNRARRIVAGLGGDSSAQIRMTAAVSELAANAMKHAGGGMIEFTVEGITAPQVLLVRICDSGPGIAGLAHILAGGHGSNATRGIAGARKIVDQFQVDSGSGGTTVSLRYLCGSSQSPLGPDELADLRRTLADSAAPEAFDEIREQNSELLTLLDELRHREEAQFEMNREIEDTNKGVVALYAELEEKAERLRNADAMKTRFLSNMSHEFRTPLNSIASMSGILLAHPVALDPEQRVQIGFIQKAAGDLTELVNDLLDIARVEAGKSVVRSMEFEVSNLFAALRGMMKPLQVDSGVELVFDEVDGLPPLVSDEGKVAQILRNFISNAMKFTPAGEIRVSARRTAEPGAMVFSVSDTGIGIKPEDQERIFEEFAQVESPIQRTVRGTGLGLPLSRKLAELLGGRLDLQSSPGQGSVFSLTLPLLYRPVFASPELLPPAWELDPGLPSVLLVDDRDDVMLIRRKLLRSGGYSLVGARNPREARQVLYSVHPRAIVLQSRGADDEVLKFLAEIRKTDATRDLPVIAVAPAEECPRFRSLGANVCLEDPVDPGRLLEHLVELTKSIESRLILIIDDEPAWRYILTHHLTALPCDVLECDNGTDGIRLARSRRPRAIFLDLMMPGISGMETLDQLKSHPATRNIPVIVTTAKVLDGNQKRELSGRAEAILPKNATTRADEAASTLKRVLWNVGLEFQP